VSTQGECDEEALEVALNCESQAFFAISGAKNENFSAVAKKAGFSA
jgi:hypothetical protein